MQYGVYDTIIALSAAVVSFVSGYVSGLDHEYFSIVISGLGIFIMLGGLAALGIFTVERRKSYAL